jgi:hypothetical protein
MRRHNVALTRNSNLAYEGALNIRESDSTYAGVARGMEEQFEMFRSDLRYRRAIRDTQEQLEIWKSNPRFSGAI